MMKASKITTVAERIEIKDMILMMLMLALLAPEDWMRGDRRVIDHWSILYDG